MRSVPFLFAPFSLARGLEDVSNKKKFANKPVDLEWYHRFLSGLLSPGGYHGSYGDPSEMTAIFLWRNPPFIRSSTRSLVSTMDFRAFATTVYNFHSDTDEHSISSSLALFPFAFPRLKYILLDGHSDIDFTRLAQIPPKDSIPITMRLCSTSAYSTITPSVPVWIEDHAGLVSSSSLSPPLSLTRNDCHNLLLLSIRHHPTRLPARFFHSPYLHALIYLDISHIPGALTVHLRQHSLCPSNLPALRILKVRDREMNDNTAFLLLEAFTSQLWSLNLADNFLNDSTFDSLLSCSFTAANRQSIGLTAAAHYDIEGMLQAPDHHIGSDNYGPFVFVLESEHSSTFSHPERYFVDAPGYDNSGGRGHTFYTRSNGHSSIRNDDADSIKAMLESAAGPEDVEANHIGGLTHLYISENRGITQNGLERFIRSHPGTLQRLDCGRVLFQAPLASFQHNIVDGIMPWPKYSSISGIIGASYAFRPIFSAELRELRVHHSFVTSVPLVHLTSPATDTADDEGKLFTYSKRAMTESCQWIAENILAPRIEMAFPLPWEPDMNPRIDTLTLTEIPRKSEGRIIQEICKFIKKAAIQEAGIEKVASQFRRGVPTVTGLRRLVLEFQSENTDSNDGVLGEAGDTLPIDAGDLLKLKDEEFCFFKDENKERSGSQKARSQHDNDEQIPLSMRAVGKNSTTGATNQSEKYLASLYNPPSIGVRLTHFPYSQANSNFPEAEYLSHTAVYGNRRFPILVWVGSGVMGKHRAINEYMLRVQNPQLRSRVGPASPVHVSAGVPERSYIFHTAWDDMIYPSEGIWLPPHLRRDGPTRRDRGTMASTLDSIKAYRKKTSDALRVAQAKADEAGQGSTTKVKPGAPHFHWGGTIEVVLHDCSSNRLN